RPLDGLRDDLLNLLADLEAGLDFADEDIQFIDRDQLLLRISKGLAQLTLLQKQLDQRAVAGRPFRAVLAGKPNAGKSSLFNALAGTEAALVSPRPGTTRDYLVWRLDLDGVTVELVDTAGLRESPGAIEAQAQALGRAGGPAAALPGGGAGAGRGRPPGAAAGRTARPRGGDQVRPCTRTAGAAGHQRGDRRGAGGIAAAAGRAGAGAAAAGPGAEPE